MSKLTYSRTVELPVCAEEAFQWHERPGALERLMPPWEDVRVECRDGGIRNGQRVQLVTRIGPLPTRWTAEHSGYQPGRQFRDTQLSGPFKSWEHTHLFEPHAESVSTLQDHIEFEIPGGAFGRSLAKHYVFHQLDRMFQYRQTTTRDDLQIHAKFKAREPLQVAVTGSRGLVGSTLVPLLTTGGHKVRRIVRSATSGGDVAWDPAAESCDVSALNGVDAVVHLAGENIAGARWNAGVKKRIRDSRVHGTRILCEALARLASPPKVLVTASAVGYYGSRGEELLDEGSPAGNGFLADVARDWEHATCPAREAGIRVVQMRFGMILSPQGGALNKMLMPFRLGGGGCVGSGSQWWSWISIDDAAGAIHHALMTDSLSGPVNAVAPDPVTNAEFTGTLGRVLRRPTFVHLPAIAVRLALGEMAVELLLASTRVKPTLLTETGYEFRHPTLELALRHLLGK
jgi:uncharacterized protein (TIGR01777 family)